MQKIIAALMVLLAFVTMVSAQEIIVQVATARTEATTEPGGGDVVVILFAGDRFPATQRANGFAQLNLNGTPGWVPVTSLEAISGTLDDLPMAAQTITRVIVPEAVVFNTPDRAANPVSTASEGDVLIVLGESEPDLVGTVFYEVQLQGRTGWVLSTQVESPIISDGTYTTGDILFEEDFDDGETFRTWGAGTYPGNSNPMQFWESITENNNTYLQTVATDNTERFLFLPNIDAGERYVIEMDIRLDTTGEIWFNLSDISGGPTCYLNLAFSNTDVNFAEEGTCPYRVFQRVPFSLTVGRWSALRIVRDRNTYTAFVDGVEIIQHEHQQTLEYGLSLSTTNAPTVSYDNIRVSELLSGNPTELVTAPPQATDDIPLSEASPTESPDLSTPGIVTVTFNGEIFLRTAPNLAANQGTAVETGVTLTVISQQTEAGLTWYEVAAPDGSTGWISGLFVEVGGG